MTDPGNPEKAIDGLLSRSLRRGADPDGHACPEPEILAAYCDRSLPPRESAHWEAHFSTCARCQDQLAALVRSDASELAAGGVAVQPEGERSSGLAWLWNWRWLVPAASAAAAVALWVAIEPAPLERMQSIATRPDESQPARSAAAPTVLDDLSALRKAADADRAPAEQDAAPIAQGVAEATRDETAFQASGRRAQRTNEVAGTAPPTVATAPELQPRSAMAQPPAPREEQERFAARELREVAAAPPAERTDAQAANRARADRPADARGRAAAADRVAVNALRAELATEPAAGILVASSNPSVLWRLGASGRIERSSDAGGTWRVQTTDVGVDLLAGSAASELVCWVVGRAGTVLRTTDGERWEQRPTPTDADLVGVEARDARSASVTAADGRRYLTTDGGRTWRSER